MWKPIKINCLNWKPSANTNMRKILETPRLILRELLEEDGDRHYADAGDALIAAACRFLEGGASHHAWPRQDFRWVVLTLAVIHCSCFALPRPRQAGDSGTPEVDKQHVDGLLAQVRHVIRF